jgi:hypothetical protein
MKRPVGHHQREAWIMASISFAIMAIGIIAGVIVQYLSRHH